jgi:replicative DNA helicase
MSEAPADGRTGLNDKYRRLTSAPWAGGNGHRAEFDGWDPPSPLTSTRPTPRFPVDTLPGWIANYVLAEAEATQTPPDLAALLTLTAVASAAGGNVRVEGKPGWVEPTNLFTAVGLPPGSRKSAVFSDVARPLELFEKRLGEDARDEVTEASIQKEIAEGIADKARRDAVKATSGVEQVQLTADAISAAQHATSIAVPVLPRLLADDVTPEALKSLLADHHHIALLSPEGDLFDMMAGRYSSGTPNLDVYLKGHAGDTMRVDRKGRDPEYVEKPALTVGLAVQPAVLQSLADKPGFRGKGLLARFLYALPVNTVGWRDDDSPPVPDPVRDAYVDQMQVLARSLHNVRGTDSAELRIDSADTASGIGAAGQKGSADSADSAAALTLRLSPEARQALLDWSAEIEPRLRPDGDLHHVADWASKLAGATLRIAALLHLASRLSPSSSAWLVPIERDAIDRAVRIARYLLEHALIVFDLMGSDEIILDARRILEWAKRTETHRFQKRTVQGALKSRFPKVEDLDPSFDLLVSHGYIQQEPLPKREKGAPGRLAAPHYRISPFYLQEQA